MAITTTPDAAVRAALHLLRLHDQADDGDDFAARLEREPALAAALFFWRHVDALALMLLPDERPPDRCWTRIEARLTRLR